MTNKNTASFNEIIELGEKARIKIVTAILTSLNDEDVDRFITVANEFFEHPEKGKEQREFMFNLLCSSNFLRKAKEEMRQSMDKELLRKIEINFCSLIDLLCILSGGKE